MYPIDRNPNTRTTPSDNQLTTDERQPADFIKLPSQSKSVSKKPLIHTSNISSIIIGKPKDWLPFGITRLFRAKRKVDHLEPSAKDLEAIEDMRTEELLMRLARLCMSVENSDLSNTPVGMRGMKRLQTHISGIYTLTTKKRLTQ